MFVHFFSIFLAYSIHMTENLASESSFQFGIHGALSIPISCTMYIVHIHCMWDTISNGLIWRMVYFAFVTEPILVWACRHSSWNQSLSYIMWNFFFSFHFVPLAPEHWAKCLKQTFASNCNPKNLFTNVVPYSRISVRLSRLSFWCRFQILFLFFFSLLFSLVRFNSMLMLLQYIVGFWTLGLSRCWPNHKNYTQNIMLLRI